MNKSIRSIIIVFIVTVCTHALAVAKLPQDFDEPIYVDVAVDYARAMKRGDLNAIIDHPDVREHPALVKLSYAASISAIGIADNYSESLETSRIVSAVFGVLATILVAIFDPFAGGLMAIHALVVKYSSQAYLEAIPLAFTIFSVLTFLRTNIEKRDAWFWLSAFALGVSTAGKFTYTPVLVIVLAYLAFFEKKIPFRWMVLFGVISVAVFFALNVTFWHHPVDRVMEALEYHASYQTGAHVAEVNYPWYQPFKWIFTDTPGDWHGGIFLYDIDPFIAAFAFAGILREWKERRWLVIWLVTGIIFLLLWGTKWPQYVLTIVPAICIMAAESARRFYHWFTHLSYYKTI